MKQARNYLLVAVAAMTAAVCVTLTDVGQVAAQSVKTQFVKITNTPDEPVPTAAQGTTNVAGTVGISGTPSVNVANTPTVALAPGSSILVDNNATNAIPVRDIDNPARQPFQASTSGQLTEGNFVVFSNLTVVPQGKLLVIEYVSGTGNVPLGQTLHFGIRTSAGGSPQGHVVIPVNRNTGLAAEEFQLSQLVRLYADPGSTVQAVVSRNHSEGFSFSEVVISGYLVDIP